MVGNLDLETLLIPCSCSIYDKTNIHLQTVYCVLNHFTEFLYSLPTWAAEHIKTAKYFQPPKRNIPLPSEVQMSTENAL